MTKEMRVYVGYYEMTDDARQAVIDVLDSDRISEGQFTFRFEQEFARYIGVRYCTAMSSGTGSIQAGFLALKYHSSFNCNKGRKVITTPLTYIATVNALYLSGFEPVFVDIDPKRFGIMPEKVEKVLENAGSAIDEYAAILPVHLMGFPCDMDRLKAIADKYNLLLLEDSAQAHGSKYKGKKTGSFGLWSAFSFYIAHNIQAGEMGALVTNNEELNRLLKQVKANGRVCDCPVCTRPDGYCPHMPTEDDEDDFDPRFTHSILGLNFKTMDFQAALGLSQLKKADKIFEARMKAVKFYNDHLSKYGDILQLPEYDENVSYLAYPIVIKDNSPINRKRLRMLLEQNGVETRPLFGSIPTQQPAYSHLAGQYKGKLPNADYIGKNGFYIGCHQYLTDEHLDKVVKTFEKIIG